VTGINGGSDDVVGAAADGGVVGASVLGASAVVPVAADAALIVPAVLPVAAVVVATALR
jgi:hypothetical protein